VVRYKVTISNNASAASSAILTTISDAINANLLIDSAAAHASWAVSGSTRGASTVSGTLTADNSAADGLAHSAPASPGGTLTATLTTILAADASGTGYAAGELKPGESVTLVFAATIQ